MGLLTQEQDAQIPLPGALEGQTLEARTVHARLLDSSGNWVWYVLEFDGRDTCVGLILTRSQAVWGQFTLTELEAISAAGSRNEPGVVRDDDFEPCSLGELAAAEPALRDWLAAELEREGLVDLDAD